MAYKSKYYDPVKAHEYYMKHRKLKGRKKKTSTADLSEAGKIAAKEVKEQLQAELKAALKKVKKGNTAERKRLRELYQQKYEAELDEIRKDSSMLKAQKQKAAKSSSGKKSGGSSKGSKASKSSGTKSGGGTQATSQAATTSKPSAEKLNAESERVSKAIKDVRDKMASMSQEQKETARELIKKLMQYYKR